MYTPSSQPHSEYEHAATLDVNEGEICGADVILCLFDILLSDRHVITSDYDPMRAYPTPMT